MGFFEAIIRALIYLLLIALAFYLCIWVLGVIGLALPGKVVNILMAIFILVAILVLARLFWPLLQGTTWFPPRQ